MWPFEIIDADGHVYETDAELFEHLEPPYSAKRTVLGFPFWPALDGYQRGAIHARLDVHETLQSSARTWIDFLDGAEIERTVLYPTAGLTCGLIRDVDWAIALARAYNNWLFARYLSVSERLHGMALLPLQDPSAAAQELRRAVGELGMLGGVLTPIGLRKSLGDSEFDPVYREAARLGCALAVHAGPAQGLGLDILDRFAQVHTLSHPYAQMIQVTSVVMNGVLDRFPTLRIGFMEAGASWVPFLMHRMNRSYQGRKHAAYIGDVARPPATYVTGGQLYFSAEPTEDGLGHVIDVIGSDTVLFSSDYPHEANLALCRAEIDAVVRNTELSPERKAKLLSGNARRFYRFPDPPRVDA